MCICMYIYNVTQCNVIVNEHLVQQYGMVRYGMYMIVCMYIYIYIQLYNMYGYLYSVDLYH